MLILILNLKRKDNINIVYLVKNNLYLWGFLI